MYRKLLVLTTILAMVYAGVLEHPAISYVSVPKVSVTHLPSIAIAAAPKLAAPTYSYYAAAAPRIDYTKLISVAPALTYAAAAPKISFAAPKISFAAPALSKVLLPAPKLALAPAPAFSYLPAPTKYSFGVAPAIALPKFAVASPVVNYAPAVKVVDAGSFEPNPEYSYSYKVDDEKSGDQKSAHESRSKDGTVSGSYSVTEPDGSKRTVEYTADHINGFKATVTREEAEQDPMKMMEMKMKEDNKKMEEAMKKGAVMVMPHPPQMMVVMKSEDAHHAVMMKH